MTYVDPNFRTKKELRAAIKAGEPVIAYEPGTFAPDVRNRKVFLEGPHYPEPHRWYAEAWTDENGYVIRIK